MREQYRFGDVHLDVGERRLSSRAGGNIPLMPKAFDLLVHLVRNSGRLVSKDELLAKIWAGSVVEEAGIAVQIAALRKALHDDSRAPRYIETVARSGYRFVARVSAIATGMLEAEVPRSSIAVLPFADLSETKDQEWFADGLVEEIIGVLARIEGLTVTARTSAFAFRGKEQDIKTIGHALRVRTVLEGSVRRSDRHIRVAVRLIDAESGYHIWSERYDRDVADVFAIQDNIARALADALQVTLEARAIGRRHVPSFKAHEAYLKAAHFVNKLTPEALDRSRRHYEEAVDLDPEFALAHAGLGQLYFSLATLDLRPAEGMSMAKACAQRALALDAELMEAHVLLGLIASTHHHDWPSCDRAFRAALRHKPEAPWAMDCYAAFYLLQIGRLDQAREMIERALQLDPLNEIYRVHLGTYLLAAGEGENAVAALREVLDINSNSWLGHAWLSSAYSFVGRPDEALRHAEHLFSLSAIPLTAGVLAGALARVGQQASAGEILAQFETKPATLIPRALYYLGAGDVDAALQAFAQALENGERFAMLPLLLRRFCAGSTRWPIVARMLNLPEA